MARRTYALETLLTQTHMFRTSAATEMLFITQLLCDKKDVLKTYCVIYNIRINIFISKVST
jgi:hypothetical protein